MKDTQMQHCKQRKSSDFSSEQHVQTAVEYTCRIMFLEMLSMLPHTVRASHHLQLQCEHMSNNQDLQGVCVAENCSNDHALSLCFAD